MWPHFWNLVESSLGYMPSIISSNWKGIFWPAGIFVVGELFRLRTEGWRTMNWPKVGRDVILLVCAYIALFGWAVIHTVYQDHETLVARIDALEASAKGPRVVIDGIFSGTTTGKFGSGEILLVTAEVRNPDSKPHSFGEVNLFVQTPNGRELPGQAYLLPHENPICVAYRSVPCMLTFLHEGYCPSKLESPLAPDENRHCWMWAAFPSDLTLRGNVAVLQVKDIFSSEVFQGKSSPLGSEHTLAPFQFNRFESRTDK